MFLYLHSHFNYQRVSLFATILWTSSFLLCCSEKLARVDKTWKVSEESWQNEFSFELGVLKMKAGGSWRFFYMKHQNTEGRDEILAEEC